MRSMVRSLYETHAQLKTLLLSSSHPPVILPCLLSKQASRQGAVPRVGIPTGDRYEKH